MSRQLEQAGEDRTRRRQDAVVRALEFGIVKGLESQGAQLRGFSVRYSEWECLITVRARVEGAPCVTFVGSEDMIGCFVKLAREASNGGLRWKEDSFAK